jgi:hypothetical protein
MGFGDVDLVTEWVDRITGETQQLGYENADCVELPPLRPEDEIRQDQLNPDGTAKPTPAPVKVKRPRIDWLISAPDMLADQWWLEQNDHKKLIENNREMKIYPQNAPLSRVQTSRTEAPGQELQQETTKTEAEELRDSEDEKPEPLRIDTKMLPSFKPLKKRRGDSGDRHESSTTRLRHRLHRAAHDIDTASSSFLSPQYHETDTSGSEAGFLSRKRRSRSGTADSTYGISRDVLEKQMAKEIAKEAKDKGTDSRPAKLLPSIEMMASPGPVEEHPDAVQLKPRNGNVSKHLRGGPTGKDISRPTSARASLEVPDHRPRYSLGSSEWDSTAPNSPETKAQKLIDRLIPNISADGNTPPRSRGSSPNRKPTLQRMKSKINHLRDRSVEPSSENKRDSIPEIVDTSSPQTRRSKASSPPSIRPPKDESDGSITPASRSGTAPRRQKDDNSGVRAFFKNKNPVSKVGNFIWGKQASPPGSRVLNGTDGEADSDEEVDPLMAGRKGSAAENAISSKQKRVQKSFLNEMPVFASPFESRGRDRNARSPERDPPSVPQSVKSDKGKDKAKPQLQLPIIQIDRASGASTPAIERDRQHSDAKSDVSNLSRVWTADSKLNAILAMPGALGPLEKMLPVTGLNPLYERRKSVASGSGVLSDDEPVAHVMDGPIQRWEVLRVRALLLSSGVKAQEIERRANEPRDLSGNTALTAGLDLTDEEKQQLTAVSKREEHIILSHIFAAAQQRAAEQWDNSATHIKSETLSAIEAQIETLRTIAEGPPNSPLRDRRPSFHRRSTSLSSLSHSSRTGGLVSSSRLLTDRAFEINEQIMSVHILEAQSLQRAIEIMMRRRRRRFRWVRRMGWVAVEWVLVGVMWWVWLVVVLVRGGWKVGRGVGRGVRWLVWL